jgi:hypothetical protein
MRESRGGHDLAEELRDGELLGRVVGWRDRYILLLP